MNTRSTSRRAERRAEYVEPAVRQFRAVHRTVRNCLTPLGAEPGHEQSSGLFMPGEGLGPLAQRGLQGRPGYSPDEGHT